MNLHQNDRLWEAFDLYVRRQDAALPTEEELSSVTLSPRFHARMNKLLTRRKRGYYRLFGTWGRRVASVVLALLIAATTVTLSVRALRERVMEFFAQIFETHTAVTFADDTPDVSDDIVFEPRKPSYVPDGYVVTQKQELPSNHRVVYANDKGEQIHYWQHWRENGELQANTEDINYTEVTIRDCKGIVYNNKGVVTLLFSDDRYTYVCSSLGSLEELIRIAESVQ